MGRYGTTILEINLFGSELRVGTRISHCYLQLSLKIRGTSYPLKLEGERDVLKLELEGRERRQRTCCPPTKRTLSCRRWNKGASLADR
jgi:hypothetical protein